jgi:subtilase family serine protease
VVANATPQSCPVGGVSICGNAKYSGLNLVGTPPVLGGTVTVSIGGSVVATTNTATDGTYCIFYNNNGNGLPCGLPYTYSVTVTDYTLTATTSTYTFTIPCVSCGGTGGTGTSYEPNFNQSSGSPSCIIENQSFNYSTSFTNNGNATSYRDTFKIFVDGNLSNTHTLDSMTIAQNTSYNDAFSLSAGNHTLSFIHTYYNAANVKSTVNGSNVINVILNKPDLYLAYFTQTSGTAFSVRNYNGSCVNAPISKTYVYDSMSGYSNSILIDSIVSSAVVGNSYVLLNLNKSSLAQGFHYLTLRTDGRNLISELNETNNELNAVLYVPLPELSIRYITVSNNNAPTGSVVNFLASVQNTGANCGAFKVRFKMNGTNIGNKISVTNLNAGDSILVTSDVFTIPSDSCTYTISAIADIDNQISELNENNNDLNYRFGIDFSSGLACSQIGSSCAPYVIPVGTTLTMGSLVYNNGLRDADTVQVRFKLGSTILGTDNITHLAANSNSAVSISHTFNTVGNYVIEINPDYDNQYCEENESNNVGYIYVAVTSGMPDLQVLSQDISPSNLNPNPNQNITIVSSIHNYGTVKSNPCSVRFLVDNVQLGVDIPIDTLYPGQDTTVAATATYSNALVGPKIIKVIADVNGVVTESIEYNNDATRAIIVGGAPDFAKSIHEGITFSSNHFRKGDTIQVCDYIRN